MQQTKQQIAQKAEPDYRMMIVAALCLLLLGAGAAFAQTADEDVPVIYVDENGQPVDAVDTIDAAPAHFYSAEELSTLVAPVALYPDDLLAIVLPASTYPLQIVQAARFLDQLKNDSSLKPDESWDESVVALLNYPEAVRLLNDDLDWTYELGDAFLAQQADVIAAVADFRNLAYDAGNLKTDDYQVVDRSGTTIRIQPADPEVIYVPYYEPREVIVYQPYPVYRYYPRRYPVYYYPYPAGYAFRSGFFFGLTTAYVIGWNNYYINAYYYNYPRHPYYGYSYYNNYRYYHPPRRYYGHGYNGGYRWRPGPRYGGRPGHRPDRNGRGGRGVRGGDDDGRVAGGGRGGNRGGGRGGRGVRGGNDDGQVAVGGRSGNRGGSAGGRGVRGGNDDGRVAGGGRGGNRGDGRGSNSGRGGNGDRGGDRGGNNVTPGGSEPGNQINRPRQRPRVVRDNASGDREGNHRRMVEPEVVSVRDAQGRNQNVQRRGNTFAREDRLDRTNQNRQANRQARGNRNQTRATEPEVVSVRNVNRDNAQGRSGTDMASVRNALNESRNRQPNRARANNQQRQSEPVRTARINPNRDNVNRANTNSRRAQPARSNQGRQVTQRPQVQPRQNQARQNHVRQSEPRAQQRRQSQARQAPQRQSQPRQQAPRQQSAPERQGRQQAPQREAKQPQRSEQRNSSRNNRGGSRRNRR